MIGENLLAPDPVLLPAEPDVVAAIAAGRPLGHVAREHPESSLAWALLAAEAEAADREIEAYAFARVGYHRGLDALRRSGWRGAGPIPWDHEPNRGVLRALDALRRAAERIGERGEAERLRAFLVDADPRASARIEEEREAR